MIFDSTSAAVIKSIKQRELFNSWLRLCPAKGRLPAIAAYAPDRLAEEMPELVHYRIDASSTPPAVIIERDGVRVTSAHGHTGQGRRLDEHLGPLIAPLVMPVYYECIARARPVYTIADVDDVFGRPVAYERLLLPFSETGTGVTHLLASLKAISSDGGFEIKNLVRGNDRPPAPRLLAVIDRDPSPRTAGISDEIEFS